MKSVPSVAVYAFSADPITYGHINIVERMSRTFERCIVGIGRNPLKKYLFSLDERRRLAGQALAHLPNVEVTAFEGMVVDLAYEQGARIIVKGVRNTADMDYEQTLHMVGVSQAMGIDTHILFADPQLGHVSSSVVKAMQAENGFIHDYVPPVVKVALEAKISRQLLIGITGAIASGKSTLAERLVASGSAMGVEVHNLDLDKLVHQLLAGEAISRTMYDELCEQLLTKLGASVISQGGIDRQRLAELVFADEPLRLWLNKALEKPLAIMLRKALKHMKGVVLINGALLPDLNLLHLCNYRCVLCSASEPEQMARMQERGYTAAHAKARLAAQLDFTQKQQVIACAIARSGFGHMYQYNSEQGAEPMSLEGLLDALQVTEALEDLQCLMT